MAISDELKASALAEIMGDAAVLLDRMQELIRNTDVVITNSTDSIRDACEEARKISVGTTMVIAEKILEDMNRVHAATVDSAKRTNTQIELLKELNKHIDNKFKTGLLSVASVSALIGGVVGAVIAVWVLK